MAGRLEKMGYIILTDTPTTQLLLQEGGVVCKTFIEGSGNASAVVGPLDIFDEAAVRKTLSDRRIARQLFTQNKISMVISFAKARPRSGNDLSYIYRRCAVDFGIGLINDSKTAVLLTQALAKYTSGQYGKQQSAVSWQSWVS